MKPNSSDLVKCLAYLLLSPLKIYENSSFYATYSVIFILSSVISILGSVVGFFNTDGKVNNLENLVSIHSQWNAVIFFLILLKSRKKLIRLFSKLELKQPNIEPIPNRTEVFVKIKLIWFAAALGISCTLFIVSSLMSYIWEDKISEKHSLLIPFWYSCGDLDLNRKFCWATLTKDDVLAKNIILIVIVNTQIFTYISTFILFGIVVGELEMHLENIGKRIDCFVKKADLVGAMVQEQNEAIDAKLVASVEEEFCQQLLEIIKNQQFLYSCISLAVDTWKTYVSIYYGTTIVDVTILFFLADMERKSEKLLTLRAITLCQMRLLMAFIIAHCSQNISHLNEDFSKQLAKIRWYERKMKFRKIYLQILSFHQNTNVIKIYGMVELNFNFYARMLYNIYSFVNLMILRYGK